MLFRALRKDLAMASTRGLFCRVSQAGRWAAWPLGLKLGRRLSADLAAKRRQGGGRGMEMDHQRLDRCGWSWFGRHVFFFGNKWPTAHYVFGVSKCMGLSHHFLKADLDWFCSSSVKLSRRLFRFHPDLRWRGRLEDRITYGTLWDSIIVPCLSFELGLPLSTTNASPAQKMLRRKTR